jgi:hypothetical protein
MKSYIKKNIYKWHKTVGVFVVIPTILWTLSGIMHPFMSHWFKTQLPEKFYIEKTIYPTKQSLGIKTILEKNKIESFKNIRFVNLKGKHFYQIKLKNNVLKYYSSKDGNELENGDKIYAQQIARQMLGDQKSNIKSITQIPSYTNEYKSVNRLLPVWKVSFDRSDKMDIYVETAHSKFSTFNDQKRKVFIWIFSNFHNWEFLSLLSEPIQYFVMLICLAVIFFTALSGTIIYGFFWKVFKKPISQEKVGALRKYHRSLGVAFSFITFLFAFSGGYHITRKFEPDNRLSFLNEPVFKTNELPLHLNQLNKNEIQMSMVKIDKLTSIQTQTFDFVTKEITFNYFKLNDTLKIENGNEKYCFSLLSDFTRNNNEKISATINKEWVTDFTNEYGFVNKRLPVMAYHLNNEKNSSYYIDPSTGHLAAYIKNADRYEGLSFAFLHKFHFLDGFGKNVRDGILVFFALCILLVSIMGLILFIKKR